MFALSHPIRLLREKWRDPWLLAKARTVVESNPPLNSTTALRFIVITASVEFPHARV